MLKLVGIKKDYKLKDQEPVHALRGVSLNFRRNEFVAILGASGCGKTTLLNITGGLDRYSDGDLIIEGKSTKDYNDRDWDTYRNHSIGFIFQSYNLITHQNVLSNVELALTISGISKKERRERAKAALIQVGLKSSLRKKPNQMSGGQMQRVAIARALVNNPEILLADEPTGALDSETSIQIMDLLKEVAKDRLVIMVTHNPDLAYKYANRIVKMNDGQIIDDSNPYDGETKEEREAAQAKRTVSKGNKKKTSMSFKTATGLSFSNLLSKLKRTVLIAVAGSIGIIGVSSVLSVSNGVSSFITGMQDDMLSSYPLTITEETVDYTSLMTGLSNWDKQQIMQFDLKTQVGLNSMIRYLMDKYTDFTAVKTNDINKQLIDYIDSMPEEYVASVNYDYGVDMTNNIFTTWKNDKNNGVERVVSINGLTQRYIAELKTVEGFGEYAVFVDLFTNFMKQLPGDKDYILQQYDLLGNSKFAENENEIMIVVDGDQTITDLILAQLGYYDETSFLNIAKKAIEENKEEPDEEYLKTLTYDEVFDIQEILDKKFYYYPHDTMWEYKQIVKPTATFTLMFPQETGELLPSKFELSYNDTNDKLEGTVSVATYCFDVSFSRTDEKESNPIIGTWEGNIMGMMDLTFTLDNSNNVIVMGVPMATYESGEDVVADGFMYPAFADSNWESTKKEVKVVGILKAKDTTNFGCLSSGVYYPSKMRKMLMDDARNSKIITDGEHGIEYWMNNSTKSSKPYKAYVTFDYTSFEDTSNPVDGIFGYANALNASMGESLSSMISITGTSAAETNKTYLRSLSGLGAKQLPNKQYEFDDIPKKISIYPESFEDKDYITEYLDQWNVEKDLVYQNKNNETKTITFEERQELTYSDTIEMIITVINSLIEAITIALISFTSLSLVVSCFMIAVITYISVMERVKEIGVIRSLGGRKKDVSRLFIAETLIIGLASGLIGVGITYLLSGLLNIIVAPFGIGRIAILTLGTALIMVLLSVVLNVLSGLIPSMKASHQDPVIALRSE